MSCCKQVSDLFFYHLCNVQPFVHLIVDRFGENGFRVYKRGKQGFLKCAVGKGQSCPSSFKIDVRQKFIFRTAGYGILLAVDNINLYIASFALEMVDKILFGKRKII